MGLTGNNAVMYFGSSWGTADCLQGSDVSDSVSDVVYQCNGYDKHVAGTRAIGFSFSLVLPSQDQTTVLTKIYPGAVSTQFYWAPAGWSSGSFDRVKYSATKATCISANVSAPINGVIALDAELALDDVTIAAATT